MPVASAERSRILVVEDELLVRMFAVDVLEEEGFAVDQAGDGGEALTLLSQADASLRAVVVDLGLPDRSGDQLAAQMQTERPELPIVIASGRSERELRERFAGDQRIAILVKPYTAAMLTDALASLGVKAS